MLRPNVCMGWAGQPMRELRGWHGDLGRHAGDAAWARGSSTDSHAKHAADSPKHAANDALKLKILTNPEARKAEFFRYQKIVQG